MLSFVLRRFFSALLVVFSVVMLVFFLIHLIPGDPVDVMLGESASSADRLALTRALGLDLPLYQQLQAFLSGLLMLDLGNSLHSGIAVSEILYQRIPQTLWLAMPAFLLALIPGVALGLLAALKHNRRTDRVLQMMAMSGLAIPNFLLGPLLVLLFSIMLGWLPVSGNASAVHVILPALTLGLSMMAIIMRMTRSTVLEVLGEDYIRTAIAKGAGTGRVVYQHVLANTWIPLMTVMGAQIGALLSGAVVTETVFDWPGLGSLLIESIQKRDYPIVQMTVLVMSIFYVLVNTLTDIAYAWVDPRIRLHD